MVPCPSSRPPPPGRFRPRRRVTATWSAVGADLAPGTLLAAYRQGLFPMGVDTHGAPSAGGPRSTWRPAPRRAAGEPVVAAVVAEVRDPGGHRLRGRGRRVCRPGRSGGWIDDDIASGLPHPARARLGALGRGLARRRARRRPVRRGHRWPLRRGVDVHPGPRRLQGRTDGPGRPAARRARRPPGARHPVADPAPGHPRAWSRSPRGDYLRRLRGVPLPAAAAVRGEVGVTSGPVLG